MQAVDIGLHAMPHDKLLFTITPRALPDDPIGSQPVSFVLQPLGLPALLLGPRPITAAQEDHLSSLFDAGLGHAWKDGRAKRQLDAQIYGRTYSEWSVYWVPIDQKGVKVDLREMNWKEGQGIVTIWPTHLAQSFQSSDRAVIGTSTRSVQSPFTFPTTADVMSGATSLFEHLSTTQEALSPTNTVAQIATPLDTADGESPPFEYEEAARTSPAEAEENGGSDVDDLFSAGSDSPGPPEPLEDIEDDQDLAMDGEPVMPGISAPTSERDTIHVLDLNDDVEMSSPPSFGYLPEQPMQVLQEEFNGVTEDDFDFFDSPGQAVTVEATVQLFDDAVGLPGLLDFPAADEDVNLFGEESPPSGVGGMTEPLGEEGPQAPISDDIAVELEDAGMLEHSAAEGVEVSGPDSQLPSALIPPITPPQDDVDIIPSEFEPIQLYKPTSAHSNPYAPPTPAPTPPALRLDALARLKPPEVEKMDYAADWDISSSESEAEEEEDYGNTPLTPISEFESEDDVVEKRKHAGKAKIAAKGVEVDWEGIRCVSAEWVVIRDEKKMLSKLARPWNKSWMSGSADKEGLGLAMPVVSKGLLDMEKLRILDLDKFASALISNRSLRKSILVDISADRVIAKEPLAEVGVDLAVLNGLSRTLHGKHCTRS
jgi:hypothetical protein